MRLRTTLVFRSAGTWRLAGFHLAVFLALGGWLAGTAAAQQSGAGAQSKAEAGDQAQAGETPAPPTGINIGNYNLQSSIEMGWRYNDITGNGANYDTLVNLQQGARLLDFSLNVHSLNHKGGLFDRLSVSGFGFGGDPNDVARVRMEKNKWYNLDFTYRRDKYFFGYNLLANPLNPANSNPEVPITFADHLIDYTRQMADFHLLLLPQSRFHLRLGYSHIVEGGPSFSTIGASVTPVSEPGTDTYFTQSYKTSTNIYSAGLDFNFLPRTTLSYDQVVQRFKQNLTGADQNFVYSLSNGEPVDLGLVFNGTTPCAHPGPPANNNFCNGYLSYDRAGSPSGTMPTERFTFKTSYFQNLTMAGQASYSSGTDTVNNLLESWAGLATRTNAAGTTTGGNAKAKRVLVAGDWAAVYDVTSKFRIEDNFDENDFRLPGYYNLSVINTFVQATPSGPNMTLPPGQFNATACPPPYTAATCPQHLSSSSPDAANGTRMRYLGQNLRTNTFQLEYDFKPSFGARLGFRYTKRDVYDYDALLYNQEIFYPGGKTGAAAAARGDCALVDSKQPFSQANLPDRCVLQTTGPLAGAIIFSGLTPASDLQHNLMADIDGYSGLFGLWVHPSKSFRTEFDSEFFSADRSYTRITPRQLQRYFVHTIYTPAGWAQVDGSVSILESRDNVLDVQDKEHNRNYSFSTTLLPNERFAFDLSYTYSDIYTQALDCFANSNSAPFGPNSCPIADSPVSLGALSVYQDTSHFANADIMWKPVKQITANFGYAANFVRGTTSFLSLTGSGSVPFLNPNTPYGPLRFNYQRPYASLTWAMSNHLAYKAVWNYYGYDARSPAGPVTLAPLGTQNFNGNNMTLSARYTF